MTENKRLLTKQETSSRRAGMDVKCFELKIQDNKLSKKQREKLYSYFSQAKWFQNDILNTEDPFKYKEKNKEVVVRWFEDGIEKKEIRALNLPSQVKQDLKQTICSDICDLSKKKKLGIKVGRLRFKKEVKSIPLRQYGCTWRFGTKKKLHIVGVGYVEVNGKDQITSDIKEFGPAKLLRKPDGLVVRIICFKDKEREVLQIIENKDIIGLDFGIKDSISLSNGEKFDFTTPIPKSLVRIQRRHSRSQLNSKNKEKRRWKIKKNYQRLVNIKNDKANKLVSKLKNQYKLIFFQDENLKGWQAGFFGKQIQQSCLGRIKSKLKKLNTAVMINRFEPTTKLCPKCGTLNKLALSERTYRCACGFVEDRDVKSAQTCVIIGLSKYSDSVPTGRRDFKPVEILTSTIADKYSLLFSDSKLRSTKQEAIEFVSMVVHGNCEHVLFGCECD